MKKVFSILLVLAVLLSVPLPIAAAETEAAVQTDISLTVGADESQLNFTWYAEDAEGGTLLVAKWSQLRDNQMPETAAQFQAAAAKANDGHYYSHQVTATGLEPDTVYAYQLINGENRSEIMTFTTGKTGAFSFAFAGDPQIGGSDDVDADIAGWANTLGILENNGLFSDISFLLTAGDHVNKDADEELYNGYLHHDFLRSLPVANVIGNHDSDSDAFGQHFNLPNESAELGVTDAGGDAWFVYNNVLFILLNSNNTSTQEHKAFMEAAIAANPDVSWKIVALHHSLYTVGKHANDKKILSRREALVPIFQELDVDVVLMGHDHVYCRTYLMDGLNPVTDPALYDGAYAAATDPSGILYVTANFSTGSKTYDCKDEAFAYAAAQNQEHTANIYKITVSDDASTITTYRATDLSVVDTFTIRRSGAVTLPFEDVEAGDWFCDEVQYVYTRGIMRGTGENTFAPDAAATRGMVVTMLYRLEGAPETGTADFSDVAPERYYAQAVAWAAEKGIVKGYGDGTFGPENPVTREQLVAILCRYWAYKGYDTTAQAQLSDFTDAGDVSRYAVGAMNWAVERGLVVGMGDGTLAPKSNATRAQIAKILTQLCKSLSGSI